MKRFMRTVVLSAAITASFEMVQAKEPPKVKEIRFCNRGEGNDWGIAENWSGGAVPGTNDVVVFNGQKTGRLTTKATVSAVRPGKGGPGGLVVDGGNLTVDSKAWSIIGYNDEGSLTVQNNGYVTFNNWLSVGREGPGNLVIDQGTVCVKKEFYHNIYRETIAGNPSSRTTLNPGGLLVVNTLVLNSGVIDIAGGILAVQKEGRFIVDECIDDGRIIAMGGKEGWKVQSTVNAKGWVMVTAVPVDG